MRSTPSNVDDTIDSRDIIARIDELTAELEDANSGEAEDVIDFDNWLTATAEDDAHTMRDAARELIALKALEAEAKGYSSDWPHGTTLIRDTYFEDYAREFADDIGAINADAVWPYDCVDWERAAHELQMDYTSVEFDGITYWVR